MREIKFRAWDKNRKALNYQLKKVISAEDGTEYEVGVFPFAGIIVTLEEALNNPQSFSIMQFTGLKDRNEKEIYEGDIIQYPSRRTGAKRREMESGFIGYDERGIEHWIYFKLDRSSYTGTQNLYAGASVVAEVIGNIYENPELLAPLEKEHPQYGKDCPECGGWERNHKANCAAVE